MLFNLQASNLAWPSFMDAGRRQRILDQRQAGLNLVPAKTHFPQVNLDIIDI